jgi:hypothetical protein
VSTYSFQRTKKHDGFLFTRSASKEDYYTTVRKYLGKKDNLFPSDKTVRGILKTYYSQKDGNTEYAEHVCFGGKKVSEAKALNLTKFPNVLVDLDEFLISQNNEIEEEEDREPPFVVII